jgi:hypothetical protein
MKWLTLETLSEKYPLLKELEPKIKEIFWKKMLF